MHRGQTPSVMQELNFGLWRHVKVPQCQWNASQAILGIQGLLAP